MNKLIKLVEEIESGETLVKELLDAGYTDFLAFEDDDAANHIVVKDLDDLEATLEDYTEEYSYTIWQEKEFEIDYKEEYLLIIGEWEGVTSYEVDPPDEPWYKVYDERKDYITIDLRVEKDGVSIKEFLKDKIDLGEY